MATSLFCRCFVCALLLLLGCSAQSVPGIVQLDGYSFPKLVDGSHNVIIRFDEKQSHEGPSQEWMSLTYQTVESHDIVVAEVLLNSQGGGGMDDYDMYGYGGMGEDEPPNGVEELMHQYGITPDMLPAYRLFVKGSDASEPKVYGSDDAKDIMTWVQSNGVYMGLEGCLKELDDLVPSFVSATSDRDSIGKQAKQFMDEYGSDKETEDESKYKSAKYYIKVMAKIVSNGETWVSKETERLGKILMGGNLSNEEWFKIRLNILSVFEMAMESSSETEKSEL